MESNNDKRFDELIGQAIVRQKHKEQLNAKIMKMVKHSQRRRKVKMWLRMVAFAMFIPLSIVTFIGCILLSTTYLEQALGVYAIVPIVLVAIVGIVTEIRLMTDFSPYDV